MTTGERAKLTSAIENVDRIIDRLSQEGASLFLADLKALRDEMNAVPEKSGTDAQKLGEQLGSAVAGLIGEPATVNVYVTVNGGRTPSFMQSGRHG